LEVFDGVALIGPRARPTAQTTWSRCLGSNPVGKADGPTIP